MSLTLNLSGLPTSPEFQKSIKESQKVFVYPSVVFSVIDHYLKRNNKQDRVIGTLLGVRKPESNVVEIKSCFPVPHFETDTHVEVDMEYHRIFYAAMKRTHPNEEIIGWYATGGSIGNHSSLIQEFYANEAGALGAVHMIVDTSLESKSLKIQVFSDLSFGSPFEQAGGCIFSPLRYELIYPEAEKNLLQLLSSDSGNSSLSTENTSNLSNENPLFAKSAQGSTIPFISDIEQLESVIKSLIEMIERVSEYIQNVIDDKVEPDPIIGNYLIDMLASVPKIESETFETLFQSHLQNLLMVIYLSNLTRAQINIANRLHHLN
ncbi:hypothetical protein BB560_003198 [Smittium megazygosporum]|uniref:Eukaryotic translation initiation factor 3 subunit F n=1 Tax=Smittium megazygosporum TaxID=133381 RepID=A0A2T9ZCP2_9FUNG|nr:hypothetical protein BB560_003198 [Smittium megazygosporum]